MSRALRRDWQYLATWTWNAPMVPERLAGPWHVVAKVMRRREQDYALMPEQTLIGECLLRGFKEGA